MLPINMSNNPRYSMREDKPGKNVLLYFLLVKTKQQVASSRFVCPPGARQNGDWRTGLSDDSADITTDLIY